MVNLGFGFGSERPTVKSHFWSSQGLTIAPTTKYTYSQQVYRIRIMYVDVVLRTCTECLPVHFLDYACISTVYVRPPGIRRNTWLTHCLLVSIYFSIPPVSLREKDGRISLFQYLDLQNEGKIRCRRRGNEEWGVIKITLPQYSCYNLTQTKRSRKYSSYSSTRTSYTSNF